MHPVLRGIKAGIAVGEVEFCAVGSVIYRITTINNVGAIGCVDPAVEQPVGIGGISVKCIFMDFAVAALADGKSRCGNGSGHVDFVAENIAASGALKNKSCRGLAGY